MSEQIDLKMPQGRPMPAYLARPAGGMATGAIVVLQEIFGVNAHIRAVADDFAAQGYLALAPALFDRLEPGVELGYAPPDINAGRALKTAAEALPAPGVLAAIEAAISYAADANGASPVKVGVVGYCWGGLLSWRAACMLNGVAAAVTYYGGGMTTGADAQRTPKVPVMSHFGEQDSAIPNNSVDAFEKRHPTVQLYRYPAQHGFNCDQRGSFNAASAAKARDRTLAFFAQHLK
ncbi:MAG: dienelactone hydrolase family protein [Burkholderiaceae bacterium]